MSSSLRKLRRSQSHVMSVYYAFLWIISVLQLLRFAVQVGEGASHATLWNLSWLLTRFGASLSPSRACERHAARGRWLHMRGGLRLQDIPLPAAAELTCGRREQQSRLA